MKFTINLFNRKLINKLEHQVDAALKRADFLEAEIERLGEVELKNRVLQMYVDDDEAICEMIDIVKKAERQIRRDQEAALGYGQASAQARQMQAISAYNQGYQQSLAGGLLGFH